MDTGAHRRMEMPANIICWSQAEKIELKRIHTRISSFYCVIFVIWTCFVYCVSFSGRWLVARRFCRCFSLPSAYQREWENNILFQIVSIQTMLLFSSTEHSVFCWPWPSFGSLFVSSIFVVLFSFHIWSSQWMLRLLPIFLFSHLQWSSYSHTNAG